MKRLGILGGVALLMVLGCESGEPPEEPDTSEKTVSKVPSIITVPAEAGAFADQEEISRKAERAAKPQAPAPTPAPATMPKESNETPAPDSTPPAAADGKE